MKLKPNPTGWWNLALAGINLFAIVAFWNPFCIVNAIVVLWCFRDAFDWTNQDG